MLYMVVARHGPQTCAFGSATIRQSAFEVVRRLEEVTRAQNCAVQGVWGNIAAHTTFYLIDAPGAHALEKVVVELGMIKLNTIDIYPVRPQAEVFEYLGSQAL